MIFTLSWIFALAFLLVLSRRWKWGWKASAAVCLIVVSTAVLYLLLPNALTRAAETLWWNRSPWKELLLLVALLFGMIAKYLWELIEIRRKKNAERKPGVEKYGLEFDFWDFVQPMLFAGVVFSVVLQSAEDVKLTTLLFSFQNGFFWQAVFRKKQAT